MLPIGKVKIKLFIVGIISFFFFFLSGIYALTNNIIVTSGNVLTTDSVDIDLKEYLVDTSHNENLYNGENITVYPGSEISIIPKIINLGSRCYVRAKFDFKVDKDLIEDSNNHIFDISNNWEKIR